MLNRPNWFPELLATKNQQDFASGDEYKKYQEKMEKQQKEILANQICGNDYVPSCKNNFYETATPAVFKVGWVHKF
jgi:hypothetical protein